MSAPDSPDVSAVDQLEQDLRDLAKSLGVDPDAPDVVVQFSGALLLAFLRFASLRQSQPTKSRRNLPGRPVSTRNCTEMLIGPWLT